MQRATAAFLCPPGFSGPTGLALAREASVVVEAARFARRRAATRASTKNLPFVHRTPPTLDADPVLLVPGFMAGDYSLRGLASHLRSQGYRTYASYIRANTGCLAETTAALERRIEAVAVKRQRKVVLLGHSLGGLLGRGMAARRPDLVSGVVAMGSPFLAPTAVHKILLFDIAMLTALQRAGLARVMSADCTSGDCARQMWEEAQRPMPAGMRFASIYSKRDGIVDWHACLDPAGEHVEVRTSHCGMALDPRVFDVVSRFLADIRVEELRADQRLAAPA